MWIFVGPQESGALCGGTTCTTPGLPLMRGDGVVGERGWMVDKGKREEWLLDFFREVFLFFLNYCRKN